jgi:fructokinase
MRTLLLGEALVDLVCERPVASPAEADSFVPHFGGAVANVAVTAARAGAKVALAGGAGDDAWGAWLRDRLAAEGVGLDHFELLGGVQTPVAFATVDAEGEPHFSIYGEAIERTVVALGERLDQAVERSAAFFFTSNTLVGEQERELTMGARQKALDLGLPVVFDPNFRIARWDGSPGRAAEVARHCVAGALLVKCNREEARLITGERDPDAAAASLLKSGAQHVVITLGPDGAMLRGGGMDLDVAGVGAQVVNATGAGDAVTGTLLARLHATGHYPPAIAAALPDAVRAGAAATERWGAV